MKKSNFITTAINIFIVITIILLIFIYQDECKKGAINGILISGNIIIPSLLPFTVCVLMLMQSGIAVYMRRISKIIYKLFGLNEAEFLTFFLSFIGGYPIGAKLLNETVKENNTNTNRANKILMYTINAGPAFIILAVGNGLLKSKLLGIVLLISHIASSLLVSFFCACSLKKTSMDYEPTYKVKSLSDNFVDSVANAAGTILNICAYIIIFSSLGEILNCIELFKPITYILEVTTAIGKTKNVYLISFLLGFGGISILLQVISCCKNFKINIISLIASRLIVGLLNSTFTYIIIKLLKIEINTFSNNAVNLPSYIYKTPSLTISLIIMMILLIIALERKFDGRNLKEDLL